MNDTPTLQAPVLLAIDARGVATVTLNRPERGNAYDEAMLAGLRQGLERLAGDAMRIGLVHEVVPQDGIEARLAAVLDAIFLGAPGAIATTKRSFLAANGLNLDARAMATLSHESWMQRASPEGIEGTAAFRERRPPGWYKAAGEPTQ